MTKFVDGFDNSITQTYKEDPPIDPDLLNKMVKIFNDYNNVTKNATKDDKTSMNVTGVGTAQTREWFLCDTIQQTTFNLCFESKYHNPSVLPGTRAYCTKCDITLPYSKDPLVRVKNDPEPSVIYLCLIKRSKGYWIGNYFTAKSGEDVLKTVRHPDTNKAMLVRGSILIKELESTYDLIKLKPIQSKSVYLFPPPKI